MIPRMRTRTALVTGVGVVNAIANDFDSFIEAVRAGRCGQRTITGFDAGGLRNPRACEAADFDPSPVYEHRDARRMDRSSELVLCAFDQAVAMARLDLHDVEPARGAVLMGSTLGGTVTGFRYYRALRKGRRRPSLLRDHSMHAPGYRVCIESGFIGPNLVFSTACTSSNLALAAAHDLVRADKHRSKDGSKDGRTMSRSGGPGGGERPKRAVPMVPEPVYEQDFVECSCRFRSGLTGLPPAGRCR